jgi:hypothetical protein
MLPASIAPGDHHQPKEEAMLRPRPIRRAGLALAVALLATAAPAVAHPVPADPQSTIPPDGEGLVETPAPVVEVVPGGFDWGDAAIGAGATLGLVLATTGGGVALTRRRARRPAVGPVAS